MRLRAALFVCSIPSFVLAIRVEDPDLQRRSASYRSLVPYHNSTASRIAQLPASIVHSEQASSSAEHTDLPESSAGASIPVTSTWTSGSGYASSPYGTSSSSSLESSDSSHDGGYIPTDGPPTSLVSNFYTPDIIKPPPPSSDGFVPTPATSKTPGATPFPPAAAGTAPHVPSGGISRLSYGTGTRSWRPYGSAPTSRLPILSVTGSIATANTSNISSLASRVPDPPVAVLLYAVDIPYGPSPITSDATSTSTQTVFVNAISVTPTLNTTSAALNTTHLPQNITSYRSSKTTANTVSRTAPVPCGGCTISPVGASVAWWYPTSLFYGFSSLTSIFKTDHEFVGVEVVPASTTFDLGSALTQESYLMLTTFDTVYNTTDVSFAITTLDPPAAATTSEVYLTAVNPLPTGQVLSPEQLADAYIDPMPVASVTFTDLANKTIFSGPSGTPYLYIPAYALIGAAAAKDGSCDDGTSLYNLSEPYYGAYNGSSDPTGRVSITESSLPPDFLSLIPQSHAHCTPVLVAEVEMLVIVTLIYDTDFTPFLAHIEASLTEAPEGPTPTGDDLTTSTVMTSGEPLLVVCGSGRCFPIIALVHIESSATESLNGPGPVTRIIGPISTSIAESGEAVTIFGQIPGHGGGSGANGSGDNESGGSGGSGSSGSSDNNGSGGAQGGQEGSDNNGGSSSGSVSGSDSSGGQGSSGGAQSGEESSGDGGGSFPDGASPANDGPPRGSNTGGKPGSDSSPSEGQPDQESSGNQPGGASSGSGAGEANSGHGGSNPSEGNNEVNGQPGPEILVPLVAHAGSTIPVTFFIPASESVSTATISFQGQILVATAPPTADPNPTVGGLVSVIQSINAGSNGPNPNSNGQNNEQDTGSSQSGPGTSNSGTENGSGSEGTLGTGGGTGTSGSLNSDDDATGSSSGEPVDIGFAETGQTSGFRPPNPGAAAGSRPGLEPGPGGWQGSTDQRPGDSVVDVAVLTVGSQIFTANGEGQFSIAPGRTLLPGSTADVHGTRISLQPGGSVAVVNGVTRTLGHTQIHNPSGSTALPTVLPAPLLTIGTRTLTANAATQYLLGPGETLTPGGVVTYQGSTISLGPSASYIVVNGKTAAIKAPQITPPPVLLVGGTSYTANAESTYYIDGQKLTPGGVITVSGTTVSLASGANYLIIDGATLTRPPVTLPSYPALTIGGSTFQPVLEPGHPGLSEYIINGKTLFPGGPAVTLSGTTVSLLPSGVGVVIDGATTTFSSTVAPITSAPVLTIEGRTYTALPGAGTTYIIDGQTLTPGGVITVDGETISLAPAATVLVVDGRTITLFPATVTTTTTATAVVPGAQVADTSVATATGDGVNNSGLQGVASKQLAVSGLGATMALALAISVAVTGLWLK